MRKAILMLTALPLLAGGCVAQAAWNVVTLPVKAGAKAVDMATVSSKERDEHYAHQQRKQAERERKDAEKARKRDRKHDDD